MRSKFGGAGDDEEEDDDVVKREMEENEPRTKHSIDGILGDRCKCRVITLHCCFFTIQKKCGIKTSRRLIFHWQLGQKTF